MDDDEEGETDGEEYDEESDEDDEYFEDGDEDGDEADSSDDQEEDPEPLASALPAVPWAIAVDLAPLFFSGELQFADANASIEGEPFASFSYRVARVAIVPVWGVVSSPAIASANGLVGYEDILAELDEARHDKRINAVLVDFDSAGGAVTGVHEAAETLRRWSKQKPVYAFVSGRACGAAYWLATACREIVAAETATLGGLGVQMIFRDESVAEEREGIQRVHIVSSSTPNKNAPVTAPAGARAWQTAVDDSAAVMLREIKRNRSQTRSRIDVAHGRTLVGMRAVRAGLADRCTTRRQLLRQLAGQ